MRRVLLAGFLFLAFIGLSGQTARADIKLPALFSDGMVLQSGATTPIWGTADPGEEVSVVLDMKNGNVLRPRTVQADAKGNWRLIIAEESATSPRPIIRRNRRVESVVSAGLAPGGPFTLTVSSKNKIAIQDVYVG